MMRDETNPALYKISIDVLGLSDEVRQVLTVDGITTIGDCVDSAKRYLYLSVSRIHTPYYWYGVTMDQLVRKLEKQGYLEDPSIETLGLSSRTIKLLKSTGIPRLSDCIHEIKRFTDPKLGFTMPEKASQFRDLFDAIKTDVIPRLIELGYLNKDGSVPKG